MKFALICLLVILYPLASRCQLSVGYESQEYYSQPEIHESFSVYVTSVSMEHEKPDTFFKGFIEKRIFSNRLLKKLIEFSDSSHFIVTEYFYRDTNVTKCIIRDDNKKILEAYYNRYHKNNNLLEERGYDRQKLIYKVSNHKSTRNQVKKTYYNHMYINAQESEHTMFSDNGREEYSVTKISDNPDSQYAWKQYNTRRQVIYQKDSAKGNVSVTKYNYDSLGRLQQISWGDPEINYIKQYSYNVHSTKMQAFYVSADTQEMKYVQEVEIKNYDSSGNIIFSIFIKYNKLIGEELPSSKTVEKYYEYNRLKKTVVKDGYIQKTYTIKYDLPDKTSLLPLKK